MDEWNYERRKSAVWIERGEALGHCLNRFAEIKVVRGVWTPGTSGKTPAAEDPGMKKYLAGGFIQTRES